MRAADRRHQGNGKEKEHQADGGFQGVDIEGVYMGGLQGLMVKRVLLIEEAGIEGVFGHKRFCFKRQSSAG